MCNLFKIVIYFFISFIYGPASIYPSFVPLNGEQVEPEPQLSLLRSSPLTPNFIFFQYPKYMKFNCANWQNISYFYITIHDWLFTCSSFGVPAKSAPEDKSYNSSRGISTALNTHNLHC